MHSELVIVKLKGNTPPVHPVTPTTQTQHDFEETSSG